ncbi:MAG: hypothetical protein Q8K86_08895 [Candidatus Nanopelagicaceae bacterium]|nr:hypothetical protein [Candidatus Nanopelagicaceae bacterium]
MSEPDEQQQAGSEDLDEVLQELESEAVIEATPISVSVPSPNIHDQPDATVSSPAITEHDQNAAAQPASADVLIREFQATASQILTRFGEDRTQIKEVVSYLWNKVRDDPMVPRVYVEQLVSALSVQAENSAGAIKLLEAQAKLLSAGKGTVLVQQNVSSNVQLDQQLGDILGGHDGK